MHPRNHPHKGPVSSDWYALSYLAIAILMMVALLYALDAYALAPPFEATIIEASPTA